MDSFRISIDQFEGPMDLMLHLVREKELDLFDLDLDVLADQYIAYIEAMDNMHLEIASEYLAELAGLLEYKSRRLLPKDKSELEDTYEEDTREQLVQRLLEYDRFQRVSETFRQLQEERMLHMDKPQEEIVSGWLKDPNNFTDARGNAYDLIKAMNRVIQRYKIMQPLPKAVARKELSIEERTVTLKANMVRLGDTFTLEDLCADVTQMNEFLVTFLSVLDMIRSGYLSVHTGDDDTIWLGRGSSHES